MHDYGLWVVSGNVLKWIIVCLSACVVFNVTHIHHRCFLIQKVRIAMQPSFNIYLWFHNRTRAIWLLCDSIYFDSFENCVYTRCPFVLTMALYKTWILSQKQSHFTARIRKIDLHSKEPQAHNIEETEFNHFNWNNCEFPHWFTLCCV